jgi:hypothetical protein
MHAAHDQSFLIDALLAIIIIAYFGIAYQFWTRRKGVGGGRATTALTQLVIIFVFCALCGYLPRLIALPEMVLIASHAVLAVAAWAYLFAGQVDRLSVAVDQSDRDTPEARRQMMALQEHAIDVETEACARLAEQTGSHVSARLLRERLQARKARASTDSKAESQLRPAAS